MPMNPDEVKAINSDEWRPVPGFPDYHISRNGVIMRTSGGARRLMSQHMNERGYMRVVLRRGGTRINHQVHRLVLSAWTRLPRDGEITRHLNGDKCDNRLENLKWGTYSENEADKHGHGTAVIGAQQTNAKLTDDIVIKARNLYRTDPRTWSLPRLARRYGVDNETMRSAVCFGMAKIRTWTHLDEIAPPCKPRGQTWRRAKQANP